MKKLTCIILAALMLLAMAAPAFAASTHQDTMNSVVRIFVEEYITVYDGKGNVVAKGPTGSQWIGSGYAVGEPGKPVTHFVTNEHVAPANYNIAVWVDNMSGDLYLTQEETIGKNVTQLPAEISHQPYVIFTDINDKKVANIVAVSDRTDLSVIALNEPTELRQAAVLRPFNANEEQMVGTPVWVIGFPSTSDYNNLTPADTLNSYISDMTESAGIITLIKDDAVTKEGERVQHDCASSGGNSGGPLVDENGYILGTHNAAWADDSGFKLAVSSNEVIRFLTDEHVEFTTVDDLKQAQMFKIIIIAAAVVLVAVVVVVVIVTGKKDKAKKASAASGNVTRTLVCDEGALMGQRFTFKDKVRVGRNPQQCHIIFPMETPGVSNVHCTIRFDGKTVTVTDENSSNGTWIDQTRLTPGVAAVMHRGQKLYLGSKKQTLSLHS